MDWQHQKESPLFPEVVWSKPETKRGAGKLAIIGGSAGAMSNVAAAYAAAENAGAGTIHLLAPDSLARITKGIPHIQYAASNPSGGFAKSALSELLTVSSAMDGVLIAGDLGKNSETSLMLESYIDKYEGILAISSLSLESFSINTNRFLDRPKTILFLNLNQLRELVIEQAMDTPVTSDIGLSQLAQILHNITSGNQCLLVAETAGRVWVSYQGKVVDCIPNGLNPAKATVWVIQQPEKLLEAAVSSMAV